MGAVVRSVAVVCTQSARVLQVAVGGRRRESRCVQGQEETERGGQREGTENKERDEE